MICDICKFWKIYLQRIIVLFVLFIFQLKPKFKDVPPITFDQWQNTIPNSDNGEENVKFLSYYNINENTVLTIL